MYQFYTTEGTLLAETFDLTTVEYLFTLFGEGAYYTYTPT